MVRKSFSELLAELSNSYETLMTEKVALESQVVALRGVPQEHESFNLIVDGHEPREIPAEGAAAQVRVQDTCLPELAFDIATDIGSTYADPEALDADGKQIRLSLCSDGGLVPAESRHSVSQPRVNTLPACSPGDNFHLEREKYWTEKGATHSLTEQQDVFERLEAAIARMEKLIEHQRKSHVGKPPPTGRVKRGQTFTAPNFIDEAARRMMKYGSHDSERSSDGEFHSEWKSARNSELESVFSQRIQRASVALEYDRHGSFAWAWEGDDKRRNSSVIQALRKTRGVVMGPPRFQQQPFDIFSGLVIITYVIFLGIETEIRSRRNMDFDTAFFVLHNIYNTYFTIELAVRMWIFRWKFFTGNDWRLNLLDTFLVVTAGLDVVMKGGASSSSARMLRSIRVARLIRTLRIVRAMRDVREFQKMVYAITSSLKTLAYSIVILFFILYFFAVVFAYGAMEARDSFASTPRDEQNAPMTEEDMKRNKSLEDLEQYWGTFFVSIYSCFISVSTGQSWYYVVKPLSEYSVVFTLCFLGFISLTLFGVLNAITAIFVESSLMSAQHYKDLIILEKANEKELALNHIRAVFRQIDEDGSGEISSGELEYFLSHEALRKYMEALNITTEDTDMLFRLLDLDGSGIIDFEEFCTGCMRLKGEARAFDLHVLLLQIRHFMDKWSNFTRYVVDHLDAATEFDGTASLQSFGKGDPPSSPLGDGTETMETIPENFIPPYRSRVQTREFTD